MQASLPFSGMEEEEGGMKAMTLRLPDELAKEIEAEARAAHRSIHAHILWLVEGALRIRALVEAWPRREVLEKMSPEEFEAYQTRLIATGLADSPFDAPFMDRVEDMKRRAHLKVSPDPTESAKGQPSSTVTEVTNRLVIVDGPVCTCGPGEQAKGKHNKWCPLRGK